MLSKSITTDKQDRYIINQVLMLALEYLLQDTILSKQECHSINSQILKTYKYKLKLSIKAINSGLHLYTTYKIFNIYDRQLNLHTKRLI